MTTLDDRLRAAAADVLEAVDRGHVPSPGAVTDGPPRLHVPGWVAATASAIVVLIAVGGTAWFLEGAAPDATQPPVTSIPEPPTSTAPPVTTSTTAATQTTVPAVAAPVPGEWVTFDMSSGLPGTPIDTVAVDDSGGVWALAHTDDPTVAQLYRAEADASVFEARGDSLQMADTWLTVWMDATPIGVILALLEGDDRTIRLLQWDASGWMDLGAEHDLPDLVFSFAERSTDGGLRVAGYGDDAGPTILDIGPSGVTYSVVPGDLWGGGGPGVFSVRHAVIPVAPDGRSWFFDGESSIAAFGENGYEVYRPETKTDCCYIPIAADDEGVWASLGSQLYRYDADGWRAETTVPTAHDEELSAIAVTSDGAIWLLARYGIARFDPGSSDRASSNGWTAHLQAEAQALGMPLIGLGSVMLDGDAVWVAGWTSDGISVWLHSGHEWAQVAVPEFIDQGDTGLRQSSVTAGVGQLWLATSTGVASFEPSP